jgi:hypothetical protein
LASCNWLIDGEIKNGRFVVSDLASQKTFGCRSQGTAARASCTMSFPFKGQVVVGVSHMQPIDRPKSLQVDGPKLCVQVTFTELAAFEMERLHPKIFNPQTPPHKALMPWLSGQQLLLLTEDDVPQLSKSTALGLLKYLCVECITSGVRIELHDIVRFGLERHWTVVPVHAACFESRECQGACMALAIGVAGLSLVLESPIL